MPGGVGDAGSSPYAHVLPPPPCAGRRQRPSVAASGERDPRHAPARWLALGGVVEAVGGGGGGVDAGDV